MFCCSFLLHSICVGQLGVGGLGMRMWSVRPVLLVVRVIGVIWRLFSLFGVFYSNKPFLDCLLTCDEKQILYYNKKRTYHWLSPKDPVLHTSKAQLHPKKIMLCVRWTAAGIVHYEFLTTGQTITAGIYSAQLERVQDALL